MRACAQIGRFLTTSSLPSVSAEACVLANAASGADPASAAQHILAPLLTQLEAELPALAQASGQLSKVPCLYISRAPWPCTQSSLHDVYFLVGDTCSSVRNQAGSKYGD
jgi:hypothetical protein